MSTNSQQIFIDALGDWEWNDSWACLAKIDPEIFQASVKLLAVPKQKKHLSVKMQSLILLSVDCAATHLYEPGIRQHIKGAATAGATLAEVLEVLELSSTLGIHACNIGLPLLVEVMKEEGLYDSHPTAGKPFDERRLAMQEDFTAKRGYWHSFWNDFLALDPEFLAAYTEFSSVPWTRQVEGNSHPGALAPYVWLFLDTVPSFDAYQSHQEKELVYCAFDAAATHLYVSGLKAHFRNALKLGATVEQIIEVLELATPLSLHTLNVAAPIAQGIYGR